MQPNASRNLSLGRRALIVGSICLLLGAPAYGDGLSLDYFLRFRTYRESITYIWSMVAALMFINYVLNFLVIGLPAMCFGGARPRKVGIGLIFLRFIGQIADRLGAVIALLALVPFTRAFGDYIQHDIRHEPTSAFGRWLSQHLWLGEHALLMLNFFFSGAAIALLAWFFLRRWSITRSLSWKIALAAAIFTNPAWAIALTSFELR